MLDTYLAIDFPESEEIMNLAETNIMLKVSIKKVHFQTELANSESTDDVAKRSEHTCKTRWISDI